MYRCSTNHRKILSPYRWVEATATKLEALFAICWRAAKGLKMKVAYKDLRLAPNSALANDLIPVSLKENY